MASPAYRELGDARVRVLPPRKINVLRRDRVFVLKLASLTVMLIVEEHLKRGKPTVERLVLAYRTRCCGQRAVVKQARMVCKSCARPVAVVASERSVTLVADGLSHSAESADVQAMLTQWLEADGTDPLNAALDLGLITTQLTQLLASLPSMLAWSRELDQ